MKKKLVSLLSLILAVVLICPTMVFAEGTPVINISANTIYTGGNHKTATLSIGGISEAQLVSVVWGVASSSSSLVSVSESGTVTANTEGREGTAYVTAEVTYKVNATEAETTTELINASIEVEKYEIDSITATNNKQYTKGQDILASDFAVTASYSDGSNGTITEGITVNPTKIPADASGSVSVVVSVGGNTDDCSVAVSSVGVTDTIDHIEIVYPADGTEFTDGTELIADDVSVNIVMVNGSVFPTSITDDSSVTVSSSSGIKFTSGKYKFTTSKSPVTLTIESNGHKDTVTLTVKANSNGSSSGNSTNVTRTATKTNSLTKTSYKVGETLKFDGITVTLSDNGTPVKTLYANELNSSVTYTFTSSDIGTNKTFYVDISYLENTYRLTLTGITVTANTNSDKLYSISSVTMADDIYNVGHEFTKADIEKIKLTLFTASGSKDTDTYTYSELLTYDFFSDVEIEVLDDEGKQKSSSSYRDTIQESDIVIKDNGDKVVNMRLKYKYYSKYSSTSTSTNYYTFTVEIGEPEIGYYYDGDLIKEYEDLEDALEYTIDDDDDWEDFELDDVKDSKYITLKLGKDYKIDSDFEEFSPRHNIVIDLNGHDLRFYSDTIVVDKDDKEYTVTVTNSSKTEAKFTYYDKDVTITLGEDDKFEFEYSTDDDYLPGLVTVTASAGTGGKITASPSLSSSGTVQVGMGSDIKFTITPEKDYAVDVIKVNSKTVSTTNNSDYSISSTGVVSYTLKGVDANTKVEVTFKETKKEWENPFTDVNSYSSYYSAVEFVYTNELFKGTTETKFAPNTTMTRAMFVTVLGRLADVDVSKYKTSSFTDVPINSSTSWYAPYVQWAVDYGIVQGYGDGTFGPNNEITHQQMYVMMYRYSMFVENNQINVRNVSLTMSDRNDVADWAVDAVKYAQQKDFLVLSGSRVDPTGDALRWELATLLESFCETVLNWAK